MVLVVIVTFADEASYLGSLLASIAAQSRQPDRLVLVDDGSLDDSAQIADAFARGRPGVTVLRRPPRPARADRLAGAPELHAFKWALEQLAEPWEVAAKLDADLDLPADTLAAVMSAIEGDPQLGLTGTFLQEAGPDGESCRIDIASDHVHGATKFYRRACWEAIQPVPEILGWDTIDEVTARLRGWRTATVAVPSGDPVHRRPRGTHDGALRAHRRWGQCAWGIGESPLHVALVTLRDLRRTPRITGALSYAAGWAQAAMLRRPRAARAVRDAVRREQLRRIRRRLRRLIGHER